MSTQQRNDACVVSVDSEAAEVLRVQTLVVLEANHHYFEDVRLLGPDAQLALARIYREAFAVLDAVGWAPRTASGAGEDVAVPLTAGHVEQLARRRRELGHGNLDRLDAGAHERAAGRAAIAADRQAARALDRVRAAYGACVDAAPSTALPA